MTCRMKVFLEELKEKNAFKDFTNNTWSSWNNPQEPGR